MPKIFSPILLFCLVILLSSCSLAADITPPAGSVQEPAQNIVEPTPVSLVYPILPPDLANGAKIFNQECAPCHGNEGLGDGPQAAQLSVPVATLGLSDFARLYTPAEWYTVVTQGSSNRFMPAFANLTDRQRWDVVAYAMSLSISEDAVIQGEALYQEKCASCHGLSGQGDGPSAAVLNTPMIDLTDQALMARTSAADIHQVISAGISPEMPAFESQLSDAERWLIVAYLRYFSYAAASASTDADQASTDSANLGSDAYPAPQAYPEPSLTQGEVLTSTTGITSTVPFTGSVAVQLVNGSGGDAPSDAVVTLYAFDAMQNTYSETLTTGPEGVYIFTDVFMPPERVFLAGVEYASGTYGSDIITVDPSTPDLSLLITVYESTSDTSALSTDRAHIFFDFSDPENVQVIEVFIISNSSEQAVVASTSNGGVVTFPLPEGYTNLQFQDGELGNRYVEVEQGFADTAPVSPGVGEYQVIFAFQMPYDRKLDFSQPMSLPTGAVVVMVPESGVKVTSPQLQDSGSRDFQGTVYHMYEGTGFLAGSSLDFTISGSPKQATASVINGGTGQSLAIGLGAFGAVLLVVGVWLYRRNHLAPVEAPMIGEELTDVSIPLDVIPDDEDTLMDAIITLDDQYHAGNLPEKAYLERRAVLKDRLKALNQE